MASRERIDRIPRTPVRGEPLTASLQSTLADLVLETMNEGVWLVNAEAVTTFVNRHTADLLGYAVDEMIGMHVSDFLDAKGRANLARNIERRRAGIEEQLVVECLRKDGSPIWLLFCSSALFDDADNFAGSLAMVADFTKHKDAETRLRAEVDELKARLDHSQSSLNAERQRSARLEREPAVSPRGIMREALAATTVVAVLGAAVASIAILTVFGVASSLPRGGAPRSKD